MYAFAADRPNRAGGWMDALQANVAIVNRYLSAQAGGNKGLRFDMGTRCGPRFADIQIVALPGPHAGYVDNFRAVAQEAQRALGDQGGPRNAVVLADSLPSVGTERGLAETITGESGEKAGAANPHNSGALTAARRSRPPRGSWMNRPTSFKYRWHRWNGTRWNAIGGAKRSKYQPKARDIGRRLRVTVAARNGDGTTATASAPTAPVGATGVSRTAAAKSTR